MINKLYHSALEAIADIPDGATIMFSGFGMAGHPVDLIHELIRQGARDLCIINNNAGNADWGLAALLKKGRVKKILCSFPRQKDSYVFDELYLSGKITLELVPQGNLAERIRAGGHGIGGFFTPTGYGTELAQDKETRFLEGKWHVLEKPLHADYAFIKAYEADRWGNCTYNKTARNFCPEMAAAAKCTIVQAEKFLPLGELDPERIVTPGIFVQRVVHIPSPWRMGDPAPQ